MPDWFPIQNADLVPSPAILVYPSRIRENLQRMIALAGDVAHLRPHVKTHKMPRIVALQLEAGIRKFKVSTIAEAEMTADAGGEDIMLAYQPVGPNIQRLLNLVEHFPAVQFSALVDDYDNLVRISRAAVARNLQLDLYVDLNVGMGRTGIAVGPLAAELYRALSQSPGLRAAGLHAYDGHLHEPDPERLAQLVHATFAPVWQLRDELRGEGYPVPKIVAAGTPTSGLLAHEEGVEVGAGTTVLWDYGQTKISPDLDFLNAAVLLARVISHPGPNRLCIDLGHKAVASEFAPPRVRFFGLEDAQPVIHSEEHLVLETERAEAHPVGTVLYGIPYHICPTVALYQEAQCVEDGRVVESWPITARNRRITI